MNKPRIATASAALAALFVIGAPLAANACDTPPAPATKVVSWLLGPGDTPSNRWVTPQTLYTNAACGDSWVQIDTYRYATPEQVEFVNGLIQTGSLTLIDGTPTDSPVFISAETVKQTACAVVVPVPTPTPTPTPVTPAVHPVPPVAQEPVTPVATPIPAPAAATPAAAPAAAKTITIATTPVAAVTPANGPLAFTGVTDTWLIWPAIVFLAGGIALSITPKRRRKGNK